MILPRAGLLFTLPALLLGMAAASLPQQQAKTDPQAEAFFEQKVRPLLVEQCYSCHSAQSKPLMGSLRLDTRAGLLKGGIQGAALVPGKPEQSLLIKAIHYTDNALNMPPKGKLTDSQIAILTEWVKMGAPWGKDDGRRIKDKNPSSSWWAFQPIKRITPPAVSSIQNPKSKIPSMLSSSRNSLRRASNPIRLPTVEL